VVLIISLFLPWFTYNYGVGTLSVDGFWHGWMYLTLFISVVVIVYLVAHAGYHEMPLRLPLAEERLLLIGTSVSAVLTILAFVFKPGGIAFHGIGWGYGAIIGLVAAIAAAAPLVLPAIRAR
jgi:hypothetical protein